MNWSEYQTAIFKSNGSENIFVNAKAGSGKTTVIVECAKKISREGSVLAMAFSNHIKGTLESKLSDYDVTVKTCHGLGLSVLINDLKIKYKLNNKKIKQLCSPELLKEYRIVSHILQVLKGGVNFSPDKLHIKKIIKDFDILIPEGFEQFYPDIIDIYHKSLCDFNSIDFNDMIAMPLYHGCKFPKFDYLYIDEAQDLNPAQIRMAKLCRGGVSMYVGDPNQAIFQFRGADRQAVSKIIIGEKCKELPLSVSYRCAKKIVEHAQEIVPDIEPYVNNPDGIVETVSDYRPVDGDFILCRTNAPLVKECLRLIKQGIPAKVLGRDVGETLLYIHERGITESKSQYYQDLIDCLKYITPQQIRKIFTDKREGITLSTIHKSKGLESDRVYLIRPDLLPHPKSTNEDAERNLEYVGRTRAKREFRYVVN